MTADTSWLWKFYDNDAPFSDLVGLPLEEAGSAKVNCYGDAETVILIRAGGRWYAQRHQQDCCESVLPEDMPTLAGPTRGAIIRHAEERTQTAEDDSCSETWTFYEVRTDAEDFTIRWVGRSNGYYSERVDFIRGPDGWEPDGLGLVSWFGGAS